MAKVRIQLNSPGMKDLLNDPGVREFLRGEAGKVLAAAQANAPVKTGAYRDSLTVWDATTDRAVVRVGSAAPHAHLVEARTGNLSRAIDAAGGV